MAWLRGSKTEFLKLIQNVYSRNERKKSYTKQKKKINTTGPIISGNATFSGELREILYFGESKNNIKSPLSQMKIME